KAIGFRWVQTVDEKSGNVIRQYKQNTFQFIPPTAIVEAIFSDPEFVEMYEQNERHGCENGIYRDYCCGNISQQNAFLKKNPNALRLQLYTDDFEPCDALKSKAGLHKQCAFYMIIRNIPKKLQSKLSNIYLVALSDSNDFKNDSASIHNILEVITDDLKVLETVGVAVNKKIIKGCLFAMSFDNLGGNATYGLVQSFKANYFCRFCECHREECKIMSKEDTSKLRKSGSYNETCARLLKEELDATESKGVRLYCKLNDLQSFHMLENYTVDILHDLLEGAVPFTLHVIFDYCFENKLFKEFELQNMIQCFNYGPLNKKNIPSKLRMISKNLGQNATQLHCLMKNIPFILIEYIDKLKAIWNLVQSLLEILQIVFSEEITESDLNRLESSIECHTKFIVNDVKKDLIPKHHFLTHYVRAIRSMGPPIFTSTMRFEAKHQDLKKIAQNTNNFKNLNKTIAEKHQTLLSLSENRYCDVIEVGSTFALFENTNDYEFFKSSPTLSIKGDEIVIKTLKLNSIIFKPGLLLLHNSLFFEINMILKSLDSYHFLCENSYRVKELDLFTNSLILDFNEHSNYALNMSDILNKQTYQKCLIRGNIHVICETLNLFKLAIV
ncbi:uncharacterized protein LOC129573284, partial [Sitodiplosis mosellana]|uniref:uncharacterized protein LOC129573284 n=1 Tax=Sitodiplosis mosellana TaxID=263140 RepID=UPI002443B15E